MSVHLVVMAGRPGTGKTTLAREVAHALRAAYLRVDAVETAVMRSGSGEGPVGPVGYVVVHELAAGTLAVGTPVVVDAVNPIHEARGGWVKLAASSGARLTVLETVLPREAEHRARVETRQPDMLGQRVPTWDEVRLWPYDPWDERIDGLRRVIDMTDAAAAVRNALDLLGLRIG